MISRPPPRRIPAAILADPESREYFTALTESLYYVWQRLDNMNRYFNNDRLLAGLPTLAGNSADDYVTFTGGNASFPSTAIGFGRVRGFNPGPIAAGTATIPAGKWGIACVHVTWADVGSTDYVTWNTNGTDGFDDEATALLNVPEPASLTDMSWAYATVKASAGNAWIAGTDSQASGSTGNPAAETWYYDSVDPLKLLVD